MSHKLPGACCAFPSSVIDAEGAQNAGVTAGWALSGLAERREVLRYGGQASARFPENTMASFEAAIRDGVDGLESGAY